MKIRKYAFSALLLACLVSGLLLRGAGLSEPFYFHPDERLIARVASFRRLLSASSDGTWKH